MAVAAQHSLGAPAILYGLRHASTSMKQIFIFHILLLLCTATFPAYTQSLLKHSSVGVRYFQGSFLTHVPKAQYLRDSYSYFGELSIQQQTDGRKAWQVVNRLPQVGVALFYGNTGSRRYMGSMAGVFPFVAWRLYKTARFNSSLRTGAGLGWVQKPYDKITNHKAVLIGTHVNGYFAFLCQAEVKLFSNLHAAAGISFSHFSNGSSTLPNLGLNIPALSVGLRYEPQETPMILKLKKDTTLKKSSVSFFTTVGLKQFPWIGSKRYAVNTFQLEWSRRYCASGRYAGGTVLFYDRALEVDPAGIPDRKRKGNKLQAGVFVGYEHLFGRLSVPLQLGAYVYNHDIYSSLFQQLGFRYRINRHWTAQLSMKTHSGKADFIHAGIGYQMK
jgi:hypothetical protein